MVGDRAGKPSGAVGFCENVKRAKTFGATWKKDEKNENVLQNKYRNIQLCFLDAKNTIAHQNLKHCPHCRGTPRHCGQCKPRWLRKIAVMKRKEKTRKEKSGLRPRRARSSAFTRQREELREIFPGTDYMFRTWCIIVLQFDGIRRNFSRKRIYISDVVHNCFAV